MLLRSAVCSVFLCFSLVTVNRQTSFAFGFVKTTESYEISLVTINRQTFYTSLASVKTMESYAVCRLRSSWTTLRIHENTTPYLFTAVHCGLFNVGSFYFRFNSSSIIAENSSAELSAAETKKIDYKWV